MIITLQRTLFIFISISLLSACNVKESLADFSQATKDFGESLKINKSSNTNSQPVTSNTALAKTKETKYTAKSNVVDTGIENYNLLEANLDYSNLPGSYNIRNVNLGQSCNSFRDLYKESITTDDNVSYGPKENNLKTGCSYYRYNRATPYVRGPINVIELAQSFTIGDINAPCIKRTKDISNKLFTKYGKPLKTEKLADLYIKYRWATKVPNQYKPVATLEATISCIAGSGDVNFSLRTQSNIVHEKFTAFAKKKHEIKLENEIKNKPRTSLSL